MSLMKRDTPELSPFSIPPLYFYFLFVQTSPRSYSLFLTEINPPLSG